MHDCTYLGRRAPSREYACRFCGPGGPPAPCTHEGAVLNRFTSMTTGDRTIRLTCHDCGQLVYELTEPDLRGLASTQIPRELWTQPVLAVRDFILRNLVRR